MPAGFFFCAVALVDPIGLVMSYRLYGDLGSGAFSAEAALAEAGAPYEFELVSLETQRAERAAISEPQSVRQDSGAAFAGRRDRRRIAAILLTLADHFPQSGLLPPQAAPARAMAYRWLAFMASEIYPFVEIVDYPARFAPEGAALPTRCAKRAKPGARALAVAGACHGRALHAGARFFAARHLCRHVLALERGRGMAQGASATLSGLAAAVSQRPAIAPVWETAFRE